MNVDRHRLAGRNCPAHKSAPPSARPGSHREQLRSTVAFGWGAVELTNDPGRHSVCAAHVCVASELQKPDGQWQLCPPFTLVQCALVAQPPLFFAHSSTSPQLCRHTPRIASHSGSPNQPRSHAHSAPEACSGHATA